MCKKKGRKSLHTTAPKIEKCLFHGLTVGDVSSPMALHQIIFSMENKNKKKANYTVSLVVFTVDLMHWCKMSVYTSKWCSLPLYTSRLL